MSAYSSKAAVLKAPATDGTNPSNVRYFTCTPASQTHELPISWAGKYVRIANETANLAQFLFSFVPTASVDQSIAAAANGGGAANLGGSVFGNSERHVFIPEAANPTLDKLYFARASGTNTSLRLELASP